MNRYVTAGIVADLALGRRVLLVAESITAGRAAFEQIASALQDADLGGGLVVRRANGGEHISLPHGGHFEFRSVRSSARGLTFDVIFFDSDPTPDQLAEFMPAWATGGEAFRA